MIRYWFNLDFYIVNSIAYNINFSQLWRTSNWKMWCSNFTHENPKDNLLSKQLTICEYCFENDVLIFQQAWFITIDSENRNWHIQMKMKNSNKFSSSFSFANKKWWLFAAIDNWLENESVNKLHVYTRWMQTPPYSTHIMRCGIWNTLSLNGSNKILKKIRKWNHERFEWRWWWCDDGERENINK